ncbi:MAG: carbon-nitrogen hydrolase family protein, partial [Acidimicrobiales bacterium]
MLNRTVKVAAVQAEPIWFDMDATTDKVIDLVSEAANNGAELVAFPETFIPGYPWQIWLDSPAAGMGLVPQYHANSPTADGPQIARIADAAKDNDINVVVGYSERGGGSLYMGQAIIDRTGTLVRSRRKLKPTHVERSVFGEGDGSDIDVHDMGFGNVGALNCWEHLQPLTKYAMFSLGEDVHCAAWPAFSLYRGAANALGPEVNNAASLMYAVEGQVFVLAPCAVIGKEGRAFFCDTPAKEQMLLEGGGFARIYGPEGTSLAEPLAEDAEGILYADCDPALQAIAKSAADPTGHYSRPDVTRLLFNQLPSPTTTTTTSATNAAAADGAVPSAVFAE